ncbi:MAG: YcjF family protein [Cyanobacteria bacterium P01_H01_bin.121]
MTVKLQRPLLIGGAGLVGGLWLWNQFVDVVSDLSGVGLVSGAIALAIWRLRRPQPQTLDAFTAALRPDSQRVTKALEQLQAALDRLQAEAQTPEQQQNYDTLIQQQSTLHAEAQRQSLRVAVWGGSGATPANLQNLLTNNPGLPAVTPYTWQVDCAEPLPLDALPLNSDPLPVDELGQAKTEVSLSADLTEADLVVLHLAGDLQASDASVVQELQRQYGCVVVALDHCDRYLPGQQASLRQKLQITLSELVPSEQITAIATQPVPIRVRRQIEGTDTLQESQEQPEPSLSELLAGVQFALNQNSPEALIQATTYRQVAQLQVSVKQTLNRWLRVRALTKIEQHQWLAGGTVLVNPVASGDMLATVAINSKLIWELSKLYQHPLTWEQAQEIAAILAELFLKFGVVELSTQALGTVLKSNSLTYLAGGIVQGIGVAYLTRIAGLSLVEYFETLDIAPTADKLAVNHTLRDRLAGIVRRTFAQQQSTQLLTGFVQTALAQWRPKSTQVAASY